MKLNAKALALSTGIVWGFIIFLITNVMVLSGYPGTTLQRVGAFYIGYRVTFLGSFVGMIWGFATMSIVAWVVAYLYNKFSK